MRAGEREQKTTGNTAGFTLIEMAVVLTIIGLIVGGVLVGKDLIEAAYVRAQITQIEKYNTAVNTFYGKYQSLPGDMNVTTATANGFATGTVRPGGVGGGDGDGQIWGRNGYYDGAGDCGICQFTGETALFWADLTDANGQHLNLINQSFVAAEIVNGSGAVGGPGAAPSYMPTAVIGGGNYIYVYSINGFNYYGMSALGNWCCINYLSVQPGLTVRQAYNIDRKVDDGFPQSGRVFAWVASSNHGWAANVGYGSDGANPGLAARANAYSCYDNGNNASNPTTYSLSQNGGAGLNCWLSFQFQ